MRIRSLVPPPGPNDLRAAAWAYRAHAAIRPELERIGVEATVSDPPPLPPVAVRSVRAVLRRRHASCLEAAMVMQRWHASHALDLDLVIGVTAPSDGFQAHAWLEGEDPRPADGFAELLRLPATRAEPGER